MLFMFPKKQNTGCTSAEFYIQKRLKKLNSYLTNTEKLKALKWLKTMKLTTALNMLNEKHWTYLFEKRSDCDDILIVKNGWITDSFSANVVFYDGTKWWTSGTPLLCGTQRARLINEGKISVCNISRNDIPKFKLAGLINAMQDLENMPVIPVDRIH